MSQSNKKKDARKVADKLKKFHDWIKEYNSLINLVAFIIASIAIWFSYSQTRELKSHTLKLKGLTESLSAQTDNLIEINSKIPTKTIQAFPGNLPKIIKEIINIEDLPKSELLICTDVLTYGFLSNHINFREYEKQLINIVTNKDREVNFSLLAYNDQLLKETFDKQFGEYRNSIVENYRKSTFYEWSKIYDRRKMDVLDSIDSYDKIKNFIFNENIRLIDKIENVKRDNSSHVTRISSTMPFFMWIKDGEKAVVSFPNYKDNVEHAFYTTDTELIKNLREIFFLIKDEKYW